MTRLISILIAAAFITGCASIDTERATEQRKQELCGEIATRNLSHCAGNHIPPPPLHPDANPKQTEKPETYKKSKTSKN